MKFVTFSAVADVLIDAALILGGDTTLKILYMKLLEANAQTGNNFQDWRPAEAILFCIWAISNYVSVVEAEVMPQVCIIHSSSKLLLPNFFIFFFSLPMNYGFPYCFCVMKGL
jgi:hypothetical protein